MLISSQNNLMSLENGIVKTADPVSSVIYPESDGLPMADNTKQFEALVSIKSNLELLHEAKLRKAGLL